MVSLTRQGKSAGVGIFWFLISPLAIVQSRTLHTLHTLSAEKFEERFWEIVKAGFAHKRKILAKNIAHLEVRPPSEEKVRAEDLKLEDWACLLGVCSN